jgi:hypothetical protein
MKKIILFSIIISMFLMISCSKGSKSETLSIPDYKKWKKPVNKIIDYPVPGHGAGFRFIYANDISYAASVSKDSRGLKKIVYPEGSYIIKESYKNKKDIGEKDPVIYGMIKNSKSSQAVAGWIYYVKKPNELLSVVSTKMCSGCHEAANEKHPYFDGNPDDSFRDYLFVPVIKGK